jgi:hypothetical protein
MQWRLCTKFNLKDVVGGFFAKSVFLKEKTAATSNDSPFPPIFAVLNLPMLYNLKNSFFAQKIL